MKNVESWRRGGYTGFKIDGGTNFVIKIISSKSYLQKSVALHVPDKQGSTQ